MLDLLRARYRHALTARRELRVLAADASAERFENLLHVARYEMLQRYGAGSDDLLRAEVHRLGSGPNWMGAEGFRELLEDGYLDS